MVEVTVNNVTIVRIFWFIFPKHPNKTLCFKIGYTEGPQEPHFVGTNFQFNSYIIVSKF